MLHQLQSQVSTHHTKIFLTSEHENVSVSLHPVIELPSFLEHYTRDHIVLISFRICSTTRIQPLSSDPETQHCENPNKTFLCFSQLPMEIQAMIWESVLGNEQELSKIFAWPPTLSIEDAPSIMLSICRNSRAFITRNKPYLFLSDPWASQKFMGYKTRLVWLDWEAFRNNVVEWCEFALWQNMKRRVKAEKIISFPRSRWELARGDVINPSRHTILFTIQL